VSPQGERLGHSGGQTTASLVVPTAIRSDVSTIRNCLLFTRASISNRTNSLLLISGRTNPTSFQSSEFRGYLYRAKKEN